MRYIWEESDLKFGSYICRQSWPEDSEDISGLCSVTCMVGWRLRGSKFCSLISITDGMVFEIQSSESRTAKERLIEYLNNDEFGYRPLNKNQVIRRINYLNEVRL